MNNGTRLVIGLCLVSVGLFWNNLVNLIPKIDKKIPKQVVQIDKPSDEVFNTVKSTADLVTDPSDKIKLCIFNNTFSKRVTSYSADAQQINDVYVQAAKNIFGDSLKGKYQGFSGSLDKLFGSVLGIENHIATDKEKSAISDTFRGLAYCLSL
jgi:hypothetical protein